jgi:hypothetical protein
MEGSFWKTVIIDSPVRGIRQKHMSSNQTITKKVTWKDEIDEIQQKNTGDPTIYKRIQKLYEHLFGNGDITQDGEF